MKPNCCISFKSFKEMKPNGCISFKSCKKMKPNGCISFKCKNFSNPCKRIVQAFKFKLSKPLFIKALRFHRCRNGVTKTSKKKWFASLRSVFHSRKNGRDIDQVTELVSFSDAGHYQQAPFPSPITPAYVKMAGRSLTKMDVHDEEDVEDACRSFEKYLVDMIVEEGKMRDLTDVEELLYCWKNLKSPVFISLVCRFYGELCKDLFSSTAEEDDTYSMV